ncbi:DUF1192 domain-containing protein [Rhizobium sp. S152]|uniref:DUF1192 domain-containing protein n=1 Tax=Rhizobium sp. S152 TaxID=3055038 RepID=UPI0025A9FC42|nr:DUF1192 domain-containing protein [Rhizobium sp. S152]MDM9625895.1 DUF1192 domain-containing protein [Rhizobium sp. S152]
MSFMDDDRPLKKPAHEIGMDLSAISVDELKTRIDMLKAEITRIEAEITRKASGRSAAENLFRS